MYKDLLLVDINPKSNFLTAIDNSPIWPCRGQDNFEFLKRLTAIFGTHIKVIDGFPNNFNNEGKEEVIALGNVETEAAIYSHLTQRRLFKVKNFNELRKRNLPSVVVTTYEHINSDLLEFLYTNENNECTPGIVAAESNESLHRQVLLCAAASVLRGKVTIPRIDFFPTLSNSSHTLIGWKTSGETYHFDNLLEAFQVGCGVLTMGVHANGLEAFLGQRYILCPVGNAPLNALKERSPACWINNKCFFTNNSIRDSIELGAIVPTDKIRARILIFNSCFGILDSKGAFDPAWSIAHRLLFDSMPGAVITSAEVLFTSSDIISPISNLIASGRPVGEIVNLFNQSPHARKYKQKMCILGDPRVCLPKNPNFEIVSAKTKTSTKRMFIISNPFKYKEIINKSILPKSLLEELKELELLKLSLNSKTVRVVNELKTIANNVMEVIEEYEKAIRKEIDISKIEFIGSLLRNRIIDFLVARGKIFPDWMPVAYIEPSSTAYSPCFICGAKSKKMIFRILIQEVSSRRFTDCPRCHIVEDSPVSSNITFHISESKNIQLKGNLPKEHWKAKILVYSVVRTDGKSYDWPVGSSGEPVENFYIPEIPPLGVFHISLFMVVGWSIVILNQKASIIRV